LAYTRKLDGFDVAMFDVHDWLVDEDDGRLHWVEVALSGTDCALDGFGATRRLELTRHDDPLDANEMDEEG